MSRGCRPGAFRRECADMHLVDDLSFDSDAPPSVVSPFEPGWIDNLRRAMRSRRLEARGRIRIETRTAVQSELIQHSGSPAVVKSGKISIAVGFQRDHAIGVNHHFQVCLTRRPYAEMRSAASKDLGPDWKPSLYRSGH